MIIVDTREQDELVKNYLKKNKIPYLEKKLNVGDYMLEENEHFVIERKHNMLEIANNICSKDHERFRREIERANENNVKIKVVIADEYIKCLNDVFKWKSPRRKIGKYYGKPFTQVKGQTLAKAMWTMQEKYGIEFLFAKEKEVPKLIYDLLYQEYYEVLKSMIRVENGYIILSDEAEAKKITGTKFPVLLGKNPHKKRGDQMLEMFGLYKEEVNPYFLKRGDIGEALVNQTFKENGYKTKTWKKKEINYDNFPENEDFGGMIDIFIEKPIKNVIEVKTKNLKDYSKIVQEGNEHEELQGMLYAYLKQVDLIMVWVFFNDETEKAIKMNLPFDVHSFNENVERTVTFHIKIIKMDNENRRLREVYMLEAQQYREFCVREKVIPLSDVSKKVLDKLKIGG